MKPDARRGALSLSHRIAIGATRLGITRAEYERHVLDGEKWCAACQQWHPRSEFGVRRTKRDGRDAICKRANLARVVAYQKRKALGVAS